MNLRRVPGRYAVARLPAQAPIPDWLSGPGLVGLVRAEDELTLICLEDRVPQGLAAQRGWACLRSVGPFPLQQPGLLASLLTPLAEAGLAVFALCTFDGEHLLIEAARADAALDALRSAGHALVDPG
ncbi:MAG: ACT domain-containing protein [Pseudomonadota bacterium]